MTHDEQVEARDRYLKCLTTLMLACWRQWRDSADSFRDHLASAHQVAVEATYRNDVDALHVVAEAEQVIAGFELQALHQSGGQTQ